jgi:hypothetical protein
MGVRWMSKILGIDSFKGIENWKDSETFVRTHVGGDEISATYRYFACRYILD